MNNEFIKWIGGEKKINTFVYDDQALPNAAKISENKIIVVWTSDGQDGSDWGIYGQLIDANGNNIGSEFLVNSYTLYSQFTPAVSSFDDGNFIVSWTSYAQDGSGYGAYAQIFDNNARKIGSEILINTYTYGDQGYADAAVDYIGGRNKLIVTKENKAVIVWVSNGQDGSYGGIYVQILNREGMKIGTEVQVNSYTANWQVLPSIEKSSNGGFVISWTSLGQDGSGWGLYMQLFNSYGNKVGQEILIPLNTHGHQLSSSITMLSENKFLVSWESNGENDGIGFDILAQSLDENGNRIGNRFMLNSFLNNDQRMPTIKSFLNGKFVFSVWQSYGQDGSEWGIYGQVIDNKGNRIGSEIKISSYSNSAQRYPDLAIASDSNHNDIRILITWESNGQDGSKYGIYSQMLSLDMSSYIQNTNNPTIIPSTSPTKFPTHEPSFAFSKAPVLIPTESPTLNPTSTETYSPTISAKPTLMPTFAPTAHPTSKDGYHEINIDSSSSDTYFGTEVADKFLVSAPGITTIFGGVGNDYYVVFYNLESTLIINDFDFSAPEKIDLTDFPDLHNIKDLTPTSSEGYIVLTLQDSQEVRLKGITLGSITNYNFIFQSTKDSSDNDSNQGNTKIVPSWVLPTIVGIIGGAILSSIGFFIKRNLYKDHDSNNHAPIGISLTDKKIELISYQKSSTKFDYYDKGNFVKTSWIGPEDVLLVYDHNDNKSVDFVKEVVFTEWCADAKTDFEALLCKFDTNNDKIFNKEDQEFSKFYIWQDRNQDGISQNFELTSLREAGVLAIDFNTQEEIEGGLRELGALNKAEVLWANGSITYAYDLVFTHDQVV